MPDPETTISSYFDPYISCPGAHDATLHFALNDGTAPSYYYRVIKNLTETIAEGLLPPKNIFVEVNNLEPGDYQINIEDAFGCFDITNLYLPDAPSVELAFAKSQYSGYNISCEGYDDGSLSGKQNTELPNYHGTDTVFVARGPYTYQWTTTDGMITGQHN